MIPEPRTELQQFLDMLRRSWIGHGTRTDYNPAGTGVQVESEYYDGNITIKMCVGWQFDESGKLVSVSVCKDD